MYIISHRGYWMNAQEENSLIAFRRALSFRLGIETDVRDALGRLVIAHDPPTGTVEPLESLLDLHHQVATASVLALNIKCDGLQPLLKDLLQKHRTANYFVFDMSAPDMMAYARGGFRFYTRHSDLEIQPILYEAAEGVWLDSILSDWLTETTISLHQDRGKRVCIVSPELHGRAYQLCWSKLKAMNAARTRDLALCTDHPEQAQEFFDA